MARSVLLFCGSSFLSQSKSRPATPPSSSCCDTQQARARPPSPPFFATFSLIMTRKTLSLLAFAMAVSHSSAQSFLGGVNLAGFEFGISTTGDSNGEVCIVPSIVSVETDFYCFTARSSA